MASDSERLAPRERGESSQPRWARPAPGPVPPLHVEDFEADSRAMDAFPSQGRSLSGNGVPPTDFFGDVRPDVDADAGLPVGDHTEIGLVGDDYEAYRDEDEFDYEYEDYFDDDEEDEDEFLEATSSFTRNALEWAVVLVGAILVALVLRASLFQAFYIPSESMEDTLMIDDRVLVNKISYDLHDINRGDIVVFHRPDDQAGEIRDLIKRVVALPGESIEARDNALYINGQRLDEPYLGDNTTTVDFEPTVVPEGQVFVMGDNRTESFDSRVFGPIDQDRVVGRAFVLFWPLNRLGSL